jgi:hypothetical protein
MDHDESPSACEGHLNGLAAAIEALHASGGLEVLVDYLAHFSEVEAALEPVLAALFVAAASGEEIDLDDVNADLGLLGSRLGTVTTFNPADRARCYLERAVEDGEAFREIRGSALLISEVAKRGAAARAEWSKWQAIVPDDLSAPAINGDIYSAAFNIARHWRTHEPYLVAAEPALMTVLGFREAGLPTDRSSWSEALDGARAGFADSAANAKLEAAIRKQDALEVAAAFAGEGA